MQVIDFRLRPPSRGFLETTMYRATDRTAKMAAGVGLGLAQSYLEKSMPRLISEMDGAGIAIAVIPGRVNSILGTVPNEDLAAITREYPGRFVAFAGLDATAVRSATHETSALIGQGFKGIVLEPGIVAPPRHLDDRRLYPLYSHLEDQGIPVLFMAGGNAGPDVGFSQPEHIDRVARDFPGLVIVSGHGNWPWVNELIHVCYRRPNIYLSPDIYMLGNMAGSSDYVTALNGFMADRFLYASAYPFVPADQALKAFLQLPIKDEVKERVLYRNAAKVLGMG